MEKEVNLSSCAEASEYTVDETIYRKITGTLIFVAVWPFIVLDMKWFPIGRPAAALIGGALMVFFTVVPQRQVFMVIGEEGNTQTICLLIGMMMLSYYYDREGLLQAAALRIFGKNRPFKHVLWKVCICSAVLSAIITNDATCLVVTPLLLMEHARQERPRNELPPLLLGIATSANIGSAATFFGNPQNAFIAANADVSLLTFFVTSLPAAIVGMAISIAILYLMYLKTIFGVSLCLPHRRRQREERRDDTPSAGGRSKECSLSVSRRQLRLTLDQSSLPNASSLMARERERMYAGHSLDTPPQVTSYTDSRELRTRIASEEPQYGTMDESLGAPDGSTHQPQPLMERKNSLFLWRGRLLQLRHEEDGEPLAAQESSVRGEMGRESLSVREEAGLGEAGTGQAEPRTWQTKAFVGWLVFVTVVLLILLAIPPPPLVSAEFNLGLVPVGAGVMTMLVDTLLNRHSAYDAIVKIDWPVIMMFWGLFIWLQGFQNTGFPSYVFRKVNKLMDLSSVGGVLVFTAFVVVGSNVISNVPLVILVVAEIESFRCSGDKDELCPSRLTGVLLAWISTVAGNFTLIGSVANLIVAEKGRTCSDYRLTFWEYLKFGLISTTFVMFIGLPVVYFAGNNIEI